MPIGGRTLKTGIAISLALAICQYLQIGPAIFAAITAMINLQPSIYQSYKNALEQINITGLGIVVGITFALVLGNSALVVGLASIVVIFVALEFGWHKVIQMGVVTAIFILDAPVANFLEHAITRMSLIGIGLVIALVVNVLLAPPDILKTLNPRVSHFHREATRFFNDEVLNFIERKEAKQQRIVKLHQMLEDATEIKDSIDILKQELHHKDEKTVKQVQLLEGLYQLSFHMINKIIVLQDIIPDRLKRTAQRGNRPYSTEFAPIIEFLVEAIVCLRNNADLLEQAIVRENEISVLQEIKSDDDLDEFLESWHQKHIGDSYYFHALMEVGIVIYEIRWIHSEQMRLYNKYLNATYEG